MPDGRPDSSTVAAFITIVVIGGFNAIAVKVGTSELEPFWGAALRFGLAAGLLASIVVIRRIAAPRGRALLGSILFGLLNFAGAYGLLYTALLDAPAGLAIVLLALVPLLTLTLAVLQGLERFRLQGLVGAVVALLGVAIVFNDQLQSSVPLPSMLAIIGATLCLAETNVVVKRFPQCDPVVNNAIAMGIGAAVLLALSLVSGAPLVLPASPAVWAALVYLVLLGSVALFTLYLFVIARWTASATSYVALLMPLVGVPAAAIALGESVSAAFLVGGLVVMAGVYIGAFAPSITRPLPGLIRRPATAAAGAGPVMPPEPPECATPGCP